PCAALWADLSTEATGGPGSAYSNRSVGPIEERSCPGDGRDRIRRAGCCGKTPVRVSVDPSDALGAPARGGPSTLAGTEPVPEGLLPAMAGADRRRGRRSRVRAADQHPVRGPGPCTGTSR